MRILNYCAGYDTGGYSIRLKQAFDQHSTHEYRSLIGRPNNYIRYPIDASPRELRRLKAWADLIHISHQPLTASDKPQVVQYHGSKFRNNPGKFLTLQHQAGAQAVCSTIDLWLIAPEMMTWLPSPYDPAWLAGFRQPIEDGVFRVAHAPTARAIKSTDHFLAAMTRLGKDIKCETVLIERKPWGQCLTMKGTADVYFDQVILGYGNNAVEAWGMGIPVIAGAQPETIGEMRRRFGVLPFYEATEDTIYDALLAMAEPATRAAYTKIGHKHFMEHHTAEAVVRTAEAVYHPAVLTEETTTHG